ncbi:MAG: cysteine hydrolase [Clostridia bacterium]|nr:cysteine hydrolase [Clostridia bacterium]
MKKLLIVVDMQNDFIDAALGSKEAQSIVDNVCRKIEQFEGDIFATFDTHSENYMQTLEGKKLPVPHCIEGSEGHKLNPKVEQALAAKGYTPVQKHTFGSFALAELIKENYQPGTFEIELIGLCTDICVVSNALLLRATFPDTAICVDAACCAGVTPAAHEAALTTMKSCQIDIV